MTVVLLGVLQWGLFGSQVVEAPGVARGTPGECMDVACIDVGVMKEAIGPGTLCALEVTEMSCCIQYSCECNEDTPDPADCKTWSVIDVYTATSWTQSMTDCFATQQCSGSQFCGDATPANCSKSNPCSRRCVMEK